MGAKVYIVYYNNANCPTTLSSSIPANIGTIIQPNIGIYITSLLFAEAYGIITIPPIILAGDRGI